MPKAAIKRLNRDIQVHLENLLERRYELSG
jgi:hypothetical protein